MIKASELRIGNFVLVSNHGDNAFKILDIGVLCTLHGGPVFKVEAKEMLNIPLTPDWLKKFGFITLDAETDIVIWGLDDGSNGEEFSIVSDGLDTPIPLYFSYDLGYREIRKEIQSVHQLQNLYFAITCEELKVNL